MRDTPYLEAAGVAPSDGEFQMVLEALREIKARLDEIEESQQKQAIDTAERKMAAKMIRGLCAFLGLVSLPNLVGLVTWFLEHVHFK
jgi:hypothetical protein